jgi:ankyrin repeat protein
MALVNHPASRNVAWCGIDARAVTRATELARRGDVAGLGAALAQAQDLLRPTYAAAQGSLAMAEMLLEHGADATRIGVGRWVLHPELAPLLASRGARIDSSGSWIGAACTGNQGRKDDPDYVRALLRHGARATDRRSGDQLKGATGVRELNATALHYAAKAGFLQTIEVLLDPGQTRPPATAAAGRRSTGWKRRRLRCRESRSGTCSHPDDRA